MLFFSYARQERGGDNINAGRTRGLCKGEGEGGEKKMKKGLELAHSLRKELCECAQGVIAVQLLNK